MLTRHVSCSTDMEVPVQGAYLVGEDPTKPNFWHNVAQHVPGKTAGECQNRMWAGYPTPKASKKTAANSGAYALAAEADSDDSRLLPPPRQNAAGELPMAHAWTFESGPLMCFRSVES